ncbi:MAG TPA: HEAT repeat domain-containing protein, partial [Geobacterales bacterium]|nr:HEAT repeat domain-containing protein [Geobacterales bacterium]
RYTVLEALGKIGKPVPTDIFGQLAADNLLKKAVYDCLAAIGDAASAVILIEGLKSRMKNAREAAANALVRVRDRLSPAEAERSVDPLLRELKGSPHLEGIMALLDSSDSNVKEVAVRLLAIIGDERSTGLLLRECGDERLRRYAVQAFRGMGDAGMAALVGMFPNVDQEGRTIIAYLCGEMGGASSAPILRDGMRDNYPPLRRAAVEAIGRLGLGQLIPDISQLLQDPHAEVREGAIGALTRLAESNAAPVLQVAQRLSSSLSGEERRDAALLFSALAAAEHLSRLVKDEDSQVRQTAVAALAGMNHKASLGPLVMALADENPEVRISAATALGEMGSEEVYQPLLLALRDEDPWVQCAALKSIGRMGNDRAMHAITSIIDRADGLVMLTALESLSAIASPVALSLVKKGLAHTDEEVVKEAIAILAEHGDGWIEEYRERLMAHPHWDVRRHFIMAMVQVQGKKALPHLKQALEREQDDMVKSQLVTIVENLR